MTIQVGAQLLLDGTCIVNLRRLLSLEKAVVRLTKENREETVAVGRLSEIPAEAAMEPVSVDLDRYTSEEWAEAEKLEDAIKPLLGSRANRRAVESLLKRFAISRATLFRRIRAYKDDSRTSVLIVRGSDGGRDGYRLDPTTEAAIDLFLPDFWTGQQPDLAQVKKELDAYCELNGIKTCSMPTFKSRAERTPIREQIETRRGREEADQKTRPHRGKTPQALRAYDVVQIDHALVDLELVDQMGRRPLRKRAWLTLAIDVYSRAVVGIYLSFDHPNSMAVALCLTSIVSNKAEWLAKRGIKLVWQMGGYKPKVVYVDNAKEFKAKALLRGARQRGIKIKHRPVQEPRYGGIIERFIGTVMREVHLIGGTTFESIERKKSTAPRPGPSMTIPELLDYILDFITTEYHLTVHSTTGETPLERYERSIVGSDDQLGLGLPPKINAREFLADFLPVIEHTIQRYGVMRDGVTYYDQVLAPFVGDDRVYLLRRNEEDISTLFFRHPATRKLHDIPSDPPIEPITLAEHMMRREQERAAKAAANKRHSRERAEGILRRRGKRKKSEEDTKRLAEERKRTRWAASTMNEIRDGAPSGRPPSRKRGDAAPASEATDAPLADFKFDPSKIRISEWSIS